MGDVLETIGSWREKLLDLTKRNRLINCRLGKSGPILLEHPGLECLWRLLATENQTLTFPWRRDLVPSHAQDGDIDAEVVGQTSFSSIADDDYNSGPIAAPEKVTLEQCLESEHLEEQHVLTSLPDKPLAGRLQRLALYDQTSISEQGVNTLYVAFRPSPVVRVSRQQ